MILASLTSALLGALAPVLLAASDSTIVRPAGTPSSRATTVSAPRRDSVASPKAPATLGVVALAPAIAHPVTGRPATLGLPDESLAVPLGFATNGRRFFGTVDSLRVEKGAHRLTLFREGMAVVSYSVALGRNPQGHKERAGDYRTPEGLYHIDARNPYSRYHLGLHVSYPNADDVARARTLGVSTGGDIMIHGLPNGQGAVGAAHRQYDWTNGCVAVTDEEIEEIWSSVPVGTPVRILP
jgi:hypothetical protein